MSVFSRICMWLGAFLLVAGTVYGLTSHEPAGTTLLLVASVTFWFLAFVARHVAKQEAERGDPEEVELHIGPTIWPFGFAIAAVLLGLGFVVSPWILIPGAVAFVGVRRGLAPRRRAVARRRRSTDDGSAARDQDRRPRAPCSTITTRNTVAWYWRGARARETGGVAARADRDALRDRSATPQASILRAHLVPPSIGSIAARVRAGHRSCGPRARRPPSTPTARTPSAGTIRTIVPAHMIAPAARWSASARRHPSACAYVGYSTWLALTIASPSNAIAGIATNR